MRRFDGRGCIDTLAIVAGFSWVDSDVRVGDRVSREPAVR